MRALNILFRTALVCCLLFESCSKVNVAGPAGPPGPPGSGSDETLLGPVHGKVMLYDTLGNAFADNSGVSVSFDHSSPATSAATSSDGGFTVPSLAAGIYNLTESKTGFGTMKYFGFNNTVGANISQTGLLSMGQQQTSWSDILRLDIDSSNYDQSHQYGLIVHLTHPHPIPDAEIVLYFSATPGAGNSNNAYTFRSNFFQQDDSTLVYTYFFATAFDESNKLYNADSVYFSAALDNPKLLFYKDSTGNEVHPAAGKTSPEIKFKNILKD